MNTTKESLQIAVSESELPEVISTQVKKLNDLQKKVDESFALAEKAKSSAETAYYRSAGIIGRKGTIESLQSSGKDQATALYEMAEAQKLSFENQQKLAEITKFLFAMGVTNIAMNRSVVRELELKLQGASKEKLSKLAKEEIITVVRQLKAQEDILKKQANMEETVRDHTKKLAQHEKMGEARDQRLDAQADKVAEYGRRLDEQADKDTELNQRLDVQAEKDIEHDRRLNEQVAKDAEHDKRLEEQAAKDQEHDALLAKQAKKDIEHDKILAQQIEKDEEHDRLFIQQELKDAEHDRLLAQQVEKDQEHDEQLAHQVEKDLEHDSRLNEQAEKDVEHDRRLAELEKRADSHDISLSQHGVDITGNTDTIKEQATMIAQLNEEIANLKLALETKASKKADLISLILAGLSLLGVIIHFCV